MQYVHTTKTGDQIARLKVNLWECMMSCRKTCGLSIFGGPRVSPSLKMCFSKTKRVVSFSRKIAVSPVPNGRSTFTCDISLRKTRSILATSCSGTPTDDMPADFFTKALQGNLFRRHRDFILTVSVDPALSDADHRSVLESDGQSDRQSDTEPTPELKPAVTADVV
jgi:hypothetical protein